MKVEINSQHQKEKEKEKGRSRESWILLNSMLASPLQLHSPSFCRTQPSLPPPHPKLLPYPKKLQQILEQRLAANKIPCLN